MCGRYVLVLRPAELRQRFVDAGLPVDEAPSDDAVRQSYNISPTYIEPVYRIDAAENGTQNVAAVTLDMTSATQTPSTSTPRYIIQPMKWGLIPSWRKNAPDYSTVAKGINCRDDSLAESQSMWSSIKHRKRCIIPAEGFYEWLNKGSQKVPHYTKRADGQLMFFAGLWDCVQYEGSEKVYTYTIVTTSSNSRLQFLHERMPVILEPEEIRKWLDPAVFQWNDRLQRLLKPFEGELTVYPVTQEVGKVGNNSPSFVIPVNERKDGIRNAFGRQKEMASTPKPKHEQHGEKRRADTPPTEEKDVKSVPARSAKIIKSNTASRKSPKKAKSIIVGGNKKITSFFTNERNSS
ncbi:hypothetical protein BDD12DRAFT_902822 [Trichophaea hybrida]|nr:hypothetical protein BDD12DRAFT_902822 [Trichophaea hybrida]